MNITAINQLIAAHSRAVGYSQKLDQVAWTLRQLRVKEEIPELEQAIRDAYQAECDLRKLCIAHGVKDDSGMRRLTPIRTAPVKLALNAK